jgi:hypothetical protein
VPSGEPLIEAGVFQPVRHFLRETAGDVPLAAEASAARNTARFSLAPADARHALSNLTDDSAATLKEFGPGSGFSGAYNHETGTFLAYPSGETRLLSGEVPAHRVGRYGGHGKVNQVLCRTTGVPTQDSFGFVAVMKEDGTFGFRWNSLSVNGDNPSFKGTQVPEHMRGPIMDAFTRATGRAARSDV